MHPYDSRRNRHAAARPATGALQALDIRVVNILLIAATIVAFVSYLVLNNGVSTKGFRMRALEQKITALQEDRQRIALAAVAGQSMETIDGRIGGMGFVPVATMDFVSAGGGAVAMR